MLESDHRSKYPGKNTDKQMNRPVTCTIHKQTTTSVNGTIHVQTDNIKIINIFSLQLNFIGITSELNTPYITLPSYTHTFHPVPVGNHTYPIQVSICIEIKFSLIHAVMIMCVLMILLIYYVCRYLS